MTHINDDQNKFPDQTTFLNNLLNDHKTIIVSLRKNIDVRDQKAGDGGTTDFLTGLVQQHEITLGILSRYMNKGIAKINNL